MLGNDLGDEEHIVAAAVGGFADELLHRAVPAEFGKFDVREAQIESRSKRRNGPRAIR